MKFHLIDDGTLDTVFADENGREYRFNYHMLDADIDYADFIVWCLEDLESGTWEG